MTNEPASDCSARVLEGALVLSFVVHGVAMVSMALLLVPAMPGGADLPDPERMRYVATHPWLFRVGWFPWGVTALSDVLIAVGLLGATWAPKAPAMLTLLLTLAAVLPDQAGQIAWMTRGVALARSGDVSAYVAYEARIFSWTAVWGGSLYTAAALGWTACFVMAGTWTRGLTVLSSVVWPLFVYVNAGPFLTADMRPSPAFVAAGNAIGFVLLEAWLAIAGETVMRRSRPEARHGRWAPWRHPNRGAGRFVDVLANSRFARALLEWLPPPSMASDITDVVYVNYLLDAERLVPLVPVGLELQRVGPGGRLAVFSFLTFRHGSFGPAFLGPLRRLLPSPVQSNFRIHVRHPGTGVLGVHFLTTAIASTVHALAARLLTDGIPMHVPGSAVLRCDERSCSLELTPKSGSAPDAHAELRTVGAPPMSGPWSGAFASYLDMLAYVVPQDRALSTEPAKCRWTRQEIHLGIPLDACEPLQGSVRSATASAIVGDAEPFSFRVARVKFLFESQTRERL